MGTQQQKAPQTKQITQFQIEVACLKVKGYVELNRDRRTNQALMKEKALNEMLRSPSRIKVEEYQKFQQLVQDVRFIETCNIVIRYCDIVKDQSIRIFRCGGDHSKISDVMTYIESILFAADNLNLEQVMEFKDLMIFYFGPGFNDTSKLMNVDQELRLLYKNPLPDGWEVNDFALKFAEKYGFSEEQLNAAGHTFNSKCKQPAQGGILIDQQPFGQQQQFILPQPQGFGVPFGSHPQSFPQTGANSGYNDFGMQGGFGQPQGGFGQPQGGFGQPQGGFGQPQGGFGQPQGGFGQPQGGFGQPQGGFGQPQGGFGQPQGGFGQPQGGFGQSQGGYGQSQGGYGQPQQGGFGQPQGGSFATQGAFNNQPQGGFSQPQSFQNNYSNQPPTAGFGQTNGTPNPYNCLNQGPQIMASQNMKVPQQYQTPQIPQVQPVIQPQQPIGQQTNNQTNQGLDDLEARLRNLDKGL